MFPEDVNKRLKLLQQDFIKISDKQMHLIETGKKGETDLELHLKNPCILFKDLERKGPKYFQNQKCADYVLLEYDTDVWAVHIFESKRTVKEKEWKQIKDQFRGALQNTLALAGVLQIRVSLHPVYVYTVFCNDKLNQYANPAKVKQRMYEKQDRANSDEWNAEEILLDFPGIGHFRHKKIQLDIETGTGSFQI